MDKFHQISTEFLPLIHVNLVSVILGIFFLAYCLQTFLYDLKFWGVV